MGLRGAQRCTSGVSHANWNAWHKKRKSHQKGHDYRKALFFFWRFPISMWNRVRAAKFLLNRQPCTQVEDTKWKSVCALCMLRQARAVLTIWLPYFVIMRKYIILQVQRDEYRAMHAYYSARQLTQYRRCAILRLANLCLHGVDGAACGLPRLGRIFRQIIIIPFTSMKYPLEHGECSAEEISIRKHTVTFDASACIAWSFLLTSKSNYCSIVNNWIRNHFNWLSGFDLFAQVVKAHSTLDKSSLFSSYTRMLGARWLISLPFTQFVTNVCVFGCEPHTARMMNWT